MANNVCSQCGAHLTGDSKTCPHCGAEIEHGTQESELQQQRMKNEKLKKRSQYAVAGMLAVLGILRIFSTNFGPDQDPAVVRASAGIGVLMILVAGYLAYRAKFKS